MEIPKHSEYDNGYHPSDQRRAEGSREGSAESTRGSGSGCHTDEGQEAPVRKNCMSITKSHLLSAFPLRQGKARLGEMFQSAQLTINAFLKFFSSVTLGQCFAISVMGADATGQMHLLQETGVTHYLVFMCVFDVGIG